VILERASSGQRTDTLARSVTRLILAKLKSPEIFSKVSKKIPANFEILDTEIPDLELPLDKITVEFEFNPAYDMQKVTVDGKYNSNPYSNDLYLYVTFPERPLRLKDIEDIYPLIVGGVRHELEHVAQFFAYGTHSLPSAPKNLQEFMRYYFDPSEIEAYVVETRMRSRANKSDPNDEMSDLFDEIMVNAESAGLPDNHLEIFENKLRKIYLDYARKRYPGVDWEL